MSRALTGFEIKVTTSNESDRPAVNTINNSGIMGDLCDNRWANTWGTTAKGVVWIRYDFVQVHTITEMWVWNYNENTRRGLRNVEIEYSSDGRSWHKLGRYEFTQASGLPNHLHDTTIDFRGVRAKSVRITALDGPNVGNYGDLDGLYGLSEVRFYVASGTSNKPPSTKHLAPAAKLRLKLNRGIAIDRQIRTIPPGPYATIERGDIKLIKSMGFDFVKLLVNPAVFMSANGLDLIRIRYIEQIINYAANIGLPVVVCIHPENDFKQECLRSESRFESLLLFYREFSAYLAHRWRPDQLALQLMTEPFGSSTKWDDWNHWDKLQHRIWDVLRKPMPSHTLILSGDMTGQIEGFYDITPVHDANVMYSFTFYEPHVFTFQAGSWQTEGLQYLKNLPYPSSPALMQSIKTYLAQVPEQWQYRMKIEIERYAVENWNKMRLQARIEQLNAWNMYYGGGRLKIWCAEFGCFQDGASPADRCRYITEVRSLFDAYGIGWAYWSYNETFSVMSPTRTPFGPADSQVPDPEILRALMPDRSK
ncbi:MAG: cellulase family glycosylhydrolase [Armatimonadota bacterium]